VDLNQLYFDHQVLLMKTQRASLSRRHEFEIEASDIAQRISRSQLCLGAAAAAQWQSIAGTQ
jgi:hypothetical protein